MAELKVTLTKAESQALADLAQDRDFSLDPAELARDWVREKLGQLPLLYEGDIAGPSADDPRELLRRRFRPDDVEVLFVGESAPEGGTFFYQADSHLFRAVREACVRAFGPLPDGTAFLDWFKERNFWLYDLSVSPINRMRGRPRKNAVDQGTVPLARVIRDLGPDFVVATKESIAASVHAAADLARLPQARVRVLPFPLYQWRRRFIEELSVFLGAERRIGDGASIRTDDMDSRTASRNRAAPAIGPLHNGGGLGLHEAIVRVLEQCPQPASSRAIANAIARDGLYVRGDGESPPASQVAARVRKYPHLFEVTPGGVSLRAGRGKA